jgi:hypothetical protein
MDSALPGAAIVDNATTLIEGLFAMLRPRMATPPIRLRSAYGRTATDRVLEARDAQDLVDRLDALVGDGEFWEREKAPVPATTPSLEQAFATLEAASLDTQSLVATLGKGAADRCEEGHQAWKQIGRIFINWVRSLKDFAEKVKALAPGARPGVVAPAKSYSNASEMLYDNDVPIVVREELTKLFLGLAAAAVIARAEEWGKKLDPWIAHALADTFASVPERILANVGVERLPAMFLAILAGTFESRVVQDVFERWYRDSVAASTGIYFPLSSADHAQAD